MHVVAPKRERQTMNLGQRLSYLELRVSITHELCRSLHTFELTILVFIWFQKLRYQIGASQWITKWSWPNVKIIITTGVYLTRGPSGPDPRPTGQGSRRFGPSLGCHASTRVGEAWVSGESRWRPLHTADRPRRLAARPPPGAKPTSPSRWRSHSPP
jgi:hypothetical protein